MEFCGVTNIYDWCNELDDESDEEIYVKKRTGDRKYVEGVTKIKEAKRKRNSGDNRAAIKKQKNHGRAKDCERYIEGVAFNKH